jgi:hypothetical protein
MSVPVWILASAALTPRSADDAVSPSELVAETRSEQLLYQLVPGPGRVALAIEVPANSAVIGDGREIDVHFRIILPLNLAANLMSTDVEATYGACVSETV